MLWTEAIYKLRKLKKDFLQPDREARRAINDRLSVATSNREPMAFGVGLVPSNRGKREDICWKILILIQRDHGDPPLTIVEPRVRSYTSTRYDISDRDAVFKWTPRFMPLMGPDHDAGGFARRACRTPSPGVQISTAVSGSGCLCCFMKPKSGGPDQLYGLTANHVATGMGTISKAVVWQPKCDATNAYQLGESDIEAPIPNGCEYPMDVAAIKLLNFDRSDIRPGTLVGSDGNIHIAGCRNLEPDVEPEVVKLGPSSGLTVGRVRGYEFGVQVFDNSASPQKTWVVESGILVAGKGEAFAKKGDSGAPVICSENRVLSGMIVCGNRTAKSYGDSVFVEIDHALAALRMDVLMRVVN
jgi:hypothetical protein